VEPLQRAVYQQVGRELSVCAFQGDAASRTNYSPGFPDNCVCSLQGSPIEFKVHDRDVTEAAAKSRPGSASVAEWSGCAVLLVLTRWSQYCTSSPALIHLLSPPPSPTSLESVDRDRSSKPPPPNNYAIVSVDASPLSRGEIDFVVRADMRPARLRLPAGELPSLIPPGNYIDASSFLTVSDGPSASLLPLLSFH
jgi:hypothetical protein